MKQRPKYLLLPLLTLTLGVGLLTNPSSAYAAAGKGLRPTPHIFWSQGPTFATATTSNLIYHGGPVMAGKMKAYAIF
jgi:hypothetical protein